MNEKYNWKLTDLFKTKQDFDSEKLKLQENMNKIQKYKDILCESSDNLYNVYVLYEQILLSFEKIYSYGMFNYHLDMTNQEAIKLFKEVENISAELGVATSFIVPEITFADEEKIREYLKNDIRLQPYTCDIESILEEKKHVLSNEKEELLANYLEVFSAPENIYDILTNAEFNLGILKDEEGNEVVLTDANYTKYLKSRNVEVRKQAFKLMYNKYKEYINTITEIYLANVKQTVITAKIRKYASSLEQATTKDDSTIKVYEALMKGIENSLQVNHDFMELKKKILKLDTMHMYDIYVNPFVEKEENITFEQAKNEVKHSLSILGEEYIKLLDEAFENNWIDVEEKPHKRGGAYSSGVYGVHPFILTNFNGNKRDVSTIAHELGHSIHSYYSNKNQNILNANYTIMVAEVASTVNEILLSEYQIANEKIEKKENLSSENLNNIYYKLNEKYFGKSIYIDNEIQYEWARIPHFYTDFYVYKYATGISAAVCIATKILNKEEGFIQKYINMLSKGRTKKSIELLKMVDVDLESEKTYIEVAKYFSKKMEELKQICKEGV